MLFPWEPLPNYAPYIYRRRAMDKSDSVAEIMSHGNVWEIKGGNGFEVIQLTSQERTFSTLESAQNYIDSVLKETGYTFISASLSCML